MEEIGLGRIDARVIDGQVVTSWINVLRCSTIIVADDKAAKDELQKMMLEMACPPNIKLEIKTIDQAANRLVEMALDAGGSDNVTLILCTGEEGKPWRRD